MLDHQSEVLAHLVRELAADPAARRTLETLATSYALRADVPGAAFLALCGMGPRQPLAHVSAWPAPRESRTSFSMPGNVQNIPKRPVAATNPATPAHPTGAPGDALQDGAGISQCEKSKNFGWPPENATFDEWTSLRKTAAGNIARLSYPAGTKP